MTGIRGESLGWDLGTTRGKREVRVDSSLDLSILSLQRSLVTLRPAQTQRRRVFTLQQA